MVDGAKPGQSAEFSPLDPAFIADPYPIYATLRRNEPVHKTRAGYWVLTRYEDVHAGIKDKRLSNAPPSHSILNSRNKDNCVAASMANNILPFLDPPKHTYTRQLISKAYLAHTKHRPPQIDIIAQRLITELREKSDFDVLNDFGARLSTIVICDILGVSKEYHQQFQTLSKWFFYLFSMLTSKLALSKIENSLAEFREIFRLIVLEKKRSPQNDLITALINIDGAEGKLSETEIIDNCILLFSDGIENVTAGLGNSILALIRHPDEFDRLYRYPELCQRAVDECLRYDSPAQFVARIACENMQIADTTIPEGDAMLLVMASANRDEEVFYEPDKLSIDRTDNPHLSFGKGFHFCLGAPLVRAELEIALNLLVQNIHPELTKLDNIKWTTRIGHRWPEGVRLTLR